MSQRRCTRPRTSPNSSAQRTHRMTGESWPEPRGRRHLCTSLSSEIKSHLTWNVLSSFHSAVRSLTTSCPSPKMIQQVRLFVIVLIVTGTLLGRCVWDGGGEQGGVTASPPSMSPLQMTLAAMRKTTSLERKKTKTQAATTMIREGRRRRKPSQKSPERGDPRGNGLQVMSLGLRQMCPVS